MCGNEKCLGFDGSHLLTKLVVVVVVVVNFIKHQNRAITGVCGNEKCLGFDGSYLQTILVRCVWE